MKVAVAALCTKTTVALLALSAVSTRVRIMDKVMD